MVEKGASAFSSSLAVLDLFFERALLAGTERSGEGNGIFVDSSPR